MNNEYMQYEVYTPGRSKRKSRAGIAVIISAVMLLGVIGASVGALTAYNRFAEFVSNRQLPYSENVAGFENAEQDSYTLETQISGDLENVFNKISAVQETTTYSPKDVFKKVQGTVVSINVRTTSNSMFYGQRESESAGSGIVFHQDDDKIYIVTNYHVIQNANSVTISFDDTTTVQAHYVGGKPEADIAVLYANKTNLNEAGISSVQTAEFADSDLVEVGDWAMAIGNAFGEGKSATLGIVSATGKTISATDGNYYNLIQTDAAINPGNSGGALVNMSGEVIGVNTVKMVSSYAEGMGYAIPSNEVMSIAEEIMRAGKNEGDPHLGITGTEITDDIKSAYNLPSKGIYVNSVVQNTTASNIGVRAGDIITKMNGIEVTTFDELVSIISNSKVGTEVSLEVVRSSRTQTGSQNTTVTLQGTMRGYSADSTNF